MKKLLIPVLMLMVACLATADDTKTVRKILEGNYKAVSVALENNQVDKIGPLLTNDFIVTAQGGQQLNKQQVLAQFKGLAGQLHDAKWVRNIRTISLKGTTATVIVEGTFNGKLDGQDGQAHTLTQNATSKDTWIKVKNKYLLKRSEVQKNSMTMDGKPMPTQGH